MNIGIVIAVIVMNIYCIVLNCTKIDRRKDLSKQDRDLMKIGQCIISFVLVMMAICGGR